MDENDAKACFLAARTEGLSERLRVMIHAMVLAEHFGVDFKFQWRPGGGDSQRHHAVLAPQATFSRSFLTKHHIDSIQTRDYPALTGRNHSPEAVRHLLSSSIKGLSIGHEPVNRLVDLSNLKNLRGYYVRAFRHIRFVPKVQAAIEAARVLPLPDNCVAVHIHAADVISQATNKAVCYPVIKRLIADLIADGKYPLIFGQDRTVCRMLADRFKLKPAADMLAQANLLPAALSEIVLMSRCETIYAGSSSFSILASMIGNKKLEIPAGKWKPEEVVHCILADDEIDNPASPLTNLQRAFSFYMVAFAGMDVVPNRVVIDALGKALVYDPGNAFYSLNKASIEVLEHDVDNAEETLKAIVDQQRPAIIFEETVLYQAIQRAVVKRLVTERLAVAVCLHNLSGLATPERPYISYITALAALIAGETAEATRLAAQAVVCDRNNPHFRHLLDLCRRPAVATDAIRLPAGQAAKKQVIAMRNDGFGERLKAMLNAMVIAESLGADFRFHWPVNDGLDDQHHIIDDRKKIFDAQFLAGHYISRLAAADYHLVKPPRKSQAELKKLIHAAPRGLIVNQEPLSRLTELGDAPDLAKRYARAFRNITFTRPLKMAMAHARAVVLPDRAVAVHLRAGDIIYGPFRFVSSIGQKVICYSVANKLIGDLIQQGKSPVIFGQDRPTCRWLAEKYGLKLGVDYLEDGSTAATALGEIVLMSRCEEIHAGVSGFATVASWIGGRPMHNPQRGLRPQQIADIVGADTDIDDPSLPLPDLQRAFSFYMVAYTGMGVIQDAVLIENLGKAIRYDPENAYYSLLRAKLQTRNRDFDGAEATLKKALENDFRLHGLVDGGPLQHVLRTNLAEFRGFVIMELRSYIATVDQFAAADRPYTCAVAALIADVSGRGDDALQLSDLACSIRPRDEILAAVAVSVRLPKPDVKKRRPAKLQLLNGSVKLEPAPAVARDGLGKKLKAMLKALF